MQPQEWGWLLQNEALTPVTTLLPPAPNELLTSIFCNGKNGCGSRCRCRKLGMQSFLACGKCNGNACLKALLYPSDVLEDDAYDPEIFQDMKINVYDNEESEDYNGSETAGQPEEDEDEKEEDS